MTGKRRSPFGAVVALIVAALGLVAIRTDPKGTGADPVARGATKAIGLGGALWLAWAAVRNRFSRGA